MPVNLIQPTPENISNPDALLKVLLRMWDQLLAVQSVAASANIVILGARTGDPGAPPPGVVYLYTVSGALYARTAIAPYLLAL